MNRQHGFYIHRSGWLAGRTRASHHGPLALLAAVVGLIATCICTADSALAQQLGFVVADQEVSRQVTGDGVSDMTFRRLPEEIRPSMTSAVSFPNSATTPDDQPRNRALELVQRSDADAVRRYRKSFLQRVRLSGSWIDSGGHSGLEIASWETAATLAVPLGSFENLLLVTPGVELDYLSAADGIEVPDQLYNAGLDLMWRKQWNDRWGSMIAVAPSIASDFQSTEDALRVTGRALATWQWVPEQLTLLFGVVYLDRNDVSVLPGVGLIWTPTPDYRLDIVFPRPKLARRLVFLPRVREDWVYLSGRLGGRTWAVERQSGLPDQLTLRDYRLSLGWERILDGGSGMFAELGYVFGRELEYEAQPFDASFDDAVMVHGGITY
jgi:hypothetical protein